MFSNYLGLDFAFKYNFPDEKRNVRTNEKTSQFSNSRQSIYCELLGNRLALSINYDRRFKNDRNGGLGYRVGIGAGNSLEQPTFPLALNYILGNGRNALETGVGITPILSLGKQTDRRRVDAAGFLNVGYRFQPLRDGLLFRLTWSPAFDTGGFYADWAGASLGYTFR